MRVTNSMIANQVVYNLGRSLSSYLKTEMQMSTGRRINTPSDDPIGTQQDMRYRTELAEIAQYQENISSGLSQLTQYDSILGGMKDTVSEAYELAVSLSNDSYDANARASAASEAASLFDQLLGLANTQSESRYLFAGFRTGTKPFVAGANGVVYTGDAGRIKSEIEPSAWVNVNLVGSDVMMKSMSTLGEDADLSVGVDAATLLADMHLGDGVDLTSGATPGHFTVTDENTGTTVDIDVSAATTLDDVVTTVNTTLAANGITDLTLEYGQQGNNLRWVSTQSGEITGVTKLSNLHNGTGVDLSEGRIMIHTSDNSIAVEVDLSSATTIDEVIQAINDALDAHADPAVHDVDAVINAGGTGIDIVDSNGVPLGLMVSEISESSSTAADLGILGNIDPTLNGADLEPQTEYTIAEAASDQTTATDLGIIGNFYGDMDGEALRPVMALNTSLSLLNNGHGMDLGEIRISQGLDVAYLDLGNSTYNTIGDVINAFNSLGLEITASINDDGTGIQVESTSSDTSLIIDEINEGNTAHELGIFGSPDIFGSMLILEHALTDNDQEVIADIIGNLNTGIQSLLNSRASVGSSVIRLETTQSRLSDLEFTYMELLSEVEDADLTELVTQLAMQETSYQSALIASSKIIQPSLLDFLD